MSGLISKMTQLNVEYRPCASLVPYAQNARKHPRAQIKLIVKSLENSDGPTLSSSVRENRCCADMVGSKQP